MEAGFLCIYDDTKYKCVVLYHGMRIHSYSSSTASAEVYTSMPSFSATTCALLSTMGEMTIIFVASL